MAGRRDWGDDGDDEGVSAGGPVVPEVADVHRRVGPPGCGKTTYLTRQVGLAARKHGRSGVVVASLTRAAASEVAGRGTELPRQNIGTLHSHAFHALGKPSICETAEGLKEWNEYAPSSSYRIDGKFAVDPENAQPEQVVFDTQGAELLNQASVLRQRMVPVEAWPPRVKRFHLKWEEWKAATGRVDFTELIEKALQKVEVLPNRPDVILLDEAQDMSKLEMSWAVQIGMQAKQFVIVGDPDQNLYQWRGSDPEAFYQAQAASEAVLAQSYRVPAAVHARAVEWVNRIPGRHEVEYNPRHVDRSDMDSPVAEGACREVGHYWKDPVSLVREVTRDLETPGQTVMILASCAYMMTPIVAELRQKGIPFYNPYRTTNGAWNPMRAGRRLLAFLRPDGRVWDGRDPETGELDREAFGSRMWDWNDLHYWTDVIQSNGVMTRGSKTLIESERYVDRFKEDLGSRQVALAKVLTMFKEDHHDAMTALDLDWWEKCLKNDARKRQEYPLRMARMHGGRILRERPRVIVGTIHSVKGGEANKVYLMPDLSSAAYYYGYKKRGNGHDAVIRQFYVGMTRASDELVLCKASGAEAVRW